MKTKTDILRAALLISSVHLCIITAELITRPYSTESVVGRSAYFNCSTNKSTQEIQWHHYPVGSTDKNIVYGWLTFRVPYLGRFRLHQSNISGTSVYDLILTAAAEQDAGKYECQDDGGNGDKSIADLTVLGTEPVCTSNLSNSVAIGPNDCGFEPDVLQLSCSVGYHGNSAPTLEWRKINDSSIITGGVTINRSDHRVNTNLTQKVHPDIDGQSYVCQTKKSLTGQQFSCKSDIIKVWHASDDFSLVHKTVGETVQCAVVTDQSKSRVQWKHINEKGENVVSSNRSITPSSPGLYRCQVDCTIKNMACSVSAMLVQVTANVTQKKEPIIAPADGGESQSYKAAFTAVLIILIVFIIVFSSLLVFYLFRRRKRSKANMREKNMLKEQQTNLIRENDEKISEMKQQLGTQNKEKEKRKKYRLRLCFDTTALRSWIVH